MKWDGDKRSFKNLGKRSDSDYFILISVCMYMGKW
jgi:hypothetical protein